MGVNSLPKTVTRQRHDCDLNPGPSAPESSTLTTRLPSHHSHCITAILSFYRIVLFCIIAYHAYMFILLILPAYAGKISRKWLPPFAADV